MTFFVLAVLTVLGGLLVIGCVRVVRPDERMVVRRPGSVRVGGPGLVWTVPLLESATRVNTQPWHELVSATTSTSDGVTAHLQAEATLRFGDLPAVEPGSRAAATDALGEALRRYVAANRLDALPGAGDLLDLTVRLPPGMAHVRTVVTGCEVDVTPELRRLVRRT